MYKLRNAAVVLQLLAAHPELASSAITWGIDDRAELWPDIRHDEPTIEADARRLADALCTSVEITPLSDERAMLTVDGTYAGVPVTLYAFPYLDDEAQSGGEG